MIGYMCAYLRYYYPKEFITSYLNNANNDDDISMGTQLAEQLGIEIRPIKFGHSTAKYSCDDVAIYKGIESIKFLNSQIADELYEIKDEKFNSFVDLLVRLMSTSVNSRQLEILIKLDFFSKFGNINKLLKINEIFNNVYSRRQFTKSKLDQYGLTEDICRKYCTKETAKMFTGVDTVAMLNELISGIDIQTPMESVLRYEYECLGYVHSVDSTANKHLFFATSVDKKKTIVDVNLYEVYTGITRRLKMWASQYDKEPFDGGMFINLISIEKKNKREPSDKFNDNGKRIWVEVPDVYEYWVKQYSVLHI